MTKGELATKAYVAKLLAEPDLYFVRAMSTIQNSITLGSCDVACPGRVQPYVVAKLEAEGFWAVGIEGGYEGPHLFIDWRPDGKERIEGLRVWHSSDRPRPRSKPKQARAPFWRLFE